MISKLTKEIAERKKTIAQYFVMVTMLPFFVMGLLLGTYTIVHGQVPGISSVFGGRIGDILKCTCKYGTHGHIFSVGSPRPGVYHFKPGARLYPYGQIRSIGAWVLGNYSAPTPCLLEIPCPNSYCCIPIPHRGDVQMVGTSLGAGGGLSSKVLDIIKKRGLNLPGQSGVDTSGPNIGPVVGAPDIPIPRPTCTLAIDPTTIREGDSATLSWNTTNAARIDLRTVTLGTTYFSNDLTPSGNNMVSPLQDATYVLRVLGLLADTSCTVSITVLPPFVTIPTDDSTVAPSFDFDIDSAGNN
jgi:hypothetical protein